MKLFELLKIFLRVFSANKKLFLFLLFYLTFSTFFLRGYYTLDPDFGWRLKVGEIIANSEIPKTDPFSYTMPSFPFVDHAWFFSLFMYLTYPIFKNGLFSLFLAILVFVSIYVSNLRTDDGNFQRSDVGGIFEKWANPLTLSAVSFLFLFFSVRAQIVSWFFFALLTTILFGKDLFARYKYFLPLLFLVWSNLHGGHSLGLMVFSYFVLFRIFINKKGHWREIIILAVSILATLATPYGPSGWREIASSIFDSRLRWSIAEWMPSITIFDVSMAFFIAVSSTMVYLKRSEVPKIQKFLFWGLLAFGLSSRRNMPYFILYALPIAITAIGSFYYEIKKNVVSEERFQIFFSALRIFAIVILLYQLYSNYWEGVFKSSSGDKMAGFYPNKAVLYLEDKNINGEIFSSYGWGGFLIWQLPDQKVFIDGRMPSWRFTPPASSGESPSAYDDYLDVMSGELDFNQTADKYNIEYVLWPVEKPSFFKEIEAKIRNTGILGDNENRFVFTKYLENNDWILVYYDETSLVYRRFFSEKI